MRLVNNTTPWNFSPSREITPAKLTGITAHCRHLRHPDLLDHQNSPLLPFSQHFQQKQDWPWPTQEVFKQSLSDASTEQLQLKTLGFYFSEIMVIKESIKGNDERGRFCTTALV